jgi:hypothetical protein
MNKGVLAEFSFAYDVIDSALAKVDGQFVNELRELELFEVGPCLVGLNPDTQLLGMKEGRRNNSRDLERIQEVHDLVCELGAKCAGPDGGGVEGEDEAKAKAKGKVEGARPGTLAARVALELLELGNG